MMTRRPSGRDPSYEDGDASGDGETSMDGEAAGALSAGLALGLPIPGLAGSAAPVQLPGPQSAIVRTGVTAQCWALHSVRQRAFCSAAATTSRRSQRRYMQSGSGR